jgi:flagellar hook-associated protein 2
MTTSPTQVNLSSLGFGGMDTTTLVSNLVAIESEPLTQAQNTETQVQSAQSTISSFSSTLSALKSAADALSTSDAFGGMSATSSDNSIVATASTGASAGQWSVSVSAIAQEQRTLSAGVASSTTALGMSGSLAVTVGTGTTASIQVNATDTLSDIVGKLNSSNLGLHASIVSDGTQSHMLVTGLETGATNTITFDDSKLTGASALGLSKPSSTLQAAQDAKVTIGGGNGTSGFSVTSASNQISGAIPGVTIAVTKPTTTPATISITTNPSSVQTNVQAFVSAYNSVITDGHTIAGYGTQAASNPLLQNDQAVRSSLDQLGYLIGEAVPGTTGAYTTLASVGINLNQDGTLTLDSTKLSTALAADPASVERLFVTDSVSGATGVMSQFGSTIDAMTSTQQGGAIQADIDGFTQREQELNTQIASLQTQIAAYQTNLQNSFTQMNNTMVKYKQIQQTLNQVYNTNSSSSSSG